MFKGYKHKGFNLSSPFLNYIVIWGLLLFLYNLRLIEYYTELNKKTITLVLGSIITYIISWLIVRSFISKKRIFKLEDMSEAFFRILKKYSDRFLTIWLTGIILTIIFQKGFPLLWLVLNINKSYADFGFPTIHGFLTSFYLFGLCGYFFYYLRFRKQKHLLLVLLLFLYPILSMNRGIMMVAICELLGVIIFFYRINIITLIKTSFFALLIILVFGVMGDYRLKHKTQYLYDYLKEDKREFFTKMPSGVFWSYFYFTGSLDNIVYNIDDLKPLYFPYYTTSTLFPTVLRNLIYETDYEKKYSLKMHNKAYNTFTYFSNYLKDFGVVGTLIILFIFQFFIWYVYSKANLKNEWAIIVYPVLYMTILLSSFSDYLLSLVIIFQMILGYFVGRRIYALSKDNKFKEVV